VSIATTDLILYGVVDRPLDDDDASGGAIDLENRPVFTQFSATAKVALVSDGADTRSVDITGRNAAGELINETVVLTGAGEVLSTNDYERVLIIAAQTTSASRTITVKQGTGGTTRATIPPDEKGVYALFINSASEAGAIERYEAIAYYNAHATLTLNSAKVTLTADPDSRIKIALEDIKDGTQSLASRLDVPEDQATDPLVFSDDNVELSVPDTTLEAETYIKVWVEQGLEAADTAKKSTFTTRLAGSSV